MSVSHRAAAAATPAQSTTAPEPAASLPEDEASVDCRAWRRRRVLLEVLQARRRVDLPARLLAPLFSLLRRLLRLRDQDSAEYLKQLGLTCLQQTCDRLEDGDAAVAEQLRTGFSVETLVQCVRSSESPQTHQLALIVLSRAAQMLPVCHHCCWVKGRQERGKREKRRSLAWHCSVANLSYFTFMLICRILSRNAYICYSCI